MADHTPSPPSDDDLHRLDPRVRMAWWVSGALPALLSVAVAAVLGVAVGGVVALVAAGAAALMVVSAVVLPPLRYARWRYTVREDDIWIREGVWWVTTTVVPFSRLQFVDTRQGPLDRMLGLASLDLHTAALGTTTTIPGLAVEEAESLRERLADVDPDVISV